jgi:beta-lactamase regulating signal transducer with metallopeptidase domain
MISEMALFLSRWVELSILGKATIMLVLGLAATRLTVRGRASVRYLFLVATFGTLLALPLMIVTIPAVTIEVPASRAFNSIAGVSAVSTSEPLLLRPKTSVGLLEPVNGGWSLPSWPMMFRFGWVAGTVILFLSLAVALWRLRRLRREGLPWPERRELTQSLATKCGVRRSIEVLVHEEIPAPLTCGVLRPAVMLPTEARNWSEAHLRRALVHELEHVRRADWVIQLAARAICACYWFHPLAWVAWRRLCLEAERACDDAVIQNADRADYAEQLVLLAQQMKARAHPVLGMANRSDLSTRVSALLDGSQRRGRVSVPTAAVAMIAASILVLAIAPVRAGSRSSKATFAASQESRSNTTPVLRGASAMDRALFEAAASGDVSSIDRLLNAGANVNCALDGDGSPLIGAARNGHLAAVRLLLDRGADPNMSVHGDGNALIMAAREGHADLVALLLDRGANIDQMVPDDENALIQASGSGHLPVVKLLVSRGADVNARIWVDVASDSKGEWRSPLSMARKGRHNGVVDFLLAAGARED